MPSITGISQTTCYQSGTNLLLPNNADRSGATNGITYSYDSNTQTFSFNGTNGKTDANWLIFNRPEFTFDGVKIGATYYFSHTLPANMYAQITYKDSNNSTHALVYLVGNASKNASVSFTIPNDFASVSNFQIGVARTLGAIDDTAVFMVSAFASADYKAYTAPTQYTASLGRTIYGGSVDVVNGTGTDNCTRIQIKDRAWTREASGDFFVFVTTGITAKALNYNFECEGYTNAQTYCSNLADKQIGTYNNTGGRNRFAIRDDSYTTSEDFITAKGDNYIVFENTTPTDFTFTPVPINSRLGDNTLWGDGDLSVTYRRDIDLALAQ